jgi:hypothetical protein
VGERYTCTYILLEEREAAVIWSGCSKAVWLHLLAVGGRGEITHQKWMQEGDTFTHTSCWRGRNPSSEVDAMMWQSCSYILLEEGEKPVIRSGYKEGKHLHLLPVGGDGEAHRQKRMQRSGTVTLTSC